MEEATCAVIGGGSWGTAIAKMLAQRDRQFNWFIRNEKTIEAFKKTKHNPNYLPAVTFETEKINFFSDLNEIVRCSDVLIFVIPAAFLKEALEQLTEDLRDKIIVSAIKGIIPEENEIIGEFFRKNYQVSYSNYCVISGPCHAEEVAFEKLSYLTISSRNEEKAHLVSEILKGNFIRTTLSDDVFGTEYTAVLKNIIAIASGICHGLRYGDNFQAVLISNAIIEIEYFVNEVHPQKRDIKRSAYLGDLLVTTYSQFSRNRTFGTMIGRGYSVRSAILELSMVAEGYYAVKGIYEIMQEKNLDMPITKAVYHILYERISPAIEIKLLSEHLQ